MITPVKQFRGGLKALWILLGSGVEMKFKFATCDNMIDDNNVR
jgi:hypothetical protein